MRGSTTAGINNSLLPRDCSCGEFACSAVWEETFSLAFVGNLPMVLYWKRLLFPNFFGIRLIRYRRGPLVVRNMRAVRKTGSCGTRRIFRVTRCKKTGFSGTGVIFGTGNPLLWYARVVVCEYVIGYFRKTDNSLKLSATLSGDGIV